VVRLKMEDDRRQALEARSIATALVVLFLVAWSFVENMAGTQPGASAPPGTTFRAAREAGASVTPSTAPSALQAPFTPPGPVEAKREEKEQQSREPPRGSLVQK
jgi:hypothetical protein